MTGMPEDSFAKRREYNQWVANQTLEDYALRFTAKTRAPLVALLRGAISRSGLFPSWHWRRPAAPITLT